MTTVNASFHIEDMFDQTLKAVQNKGTEIKNAMAKLDGKTLSTEDMLALQFEVGQYNAMLESLSTVTKTLVDESKNLAQRAS